ncbi:MAG: cytochrome c oxidase subunit II [Polyangiales bacterium]
MQLPLLGALASVLAPMAGQEPLVSRPLDISVDGHRIDTHFDLAMVAIAFLFIVMCTVMFIALTRHRESVGARAKYDHGASRKATMGIVGLCLAIFFVVDGALLVLSFADLHGKFWNFPTGKDTLEVEILGQQWGWNVRYPGPDEKFGTKDDVVLFNEMRVPTGRPVHLRMRSMDVIHAFWLPNFRIKQDVVPGMTTQMWFEAKEVGGPFDIGCAQHCGANHYKMHGVIYVQDPQTFSQWYATTSKDAERRFDETDVAGHWAWDWESK